MLVAVDGGKGGDTGRWLGVGSGGHPGEAGAPETGRDNGGATWVGPGRGSTKGERWEQDNLAPIAFRFLSNKIETIGHKYSHNT